ncbi:MAG: hypothetical protein FWB91_14305 [Defluviitaleaceae bacterium]|nr:hypothetical protein [Defluviitaleaceae bacterium]
MSAVNSLHQVSRAYPIPPHVKAAGFTSVMPSPADAPLALKEDAEYPLAAQKEVGYEILIQKFTTQFAAKGDLMAKQSEEYLLEKEIVSCSENIPENLPPGTIFIGNEGHTIGRTAMQVVMVEYGGTRWEAFVTPDGVWIAKEGWQSLEEFASLDTAQGVPGIPDSVLLDLTYIGKMLQHMPPPQLVNTGGVRHSVNVIVTQHNISGSSAESGVPTSESTPSSTYEILRESLRQIANAFAEVHQEFGGSSQHIESAFWHMLRNTLGLSAHLARLNLGGERVANLDSEAISQLHTNARRQLELFGETFLTKFKQYGLEDGFNVAWAKLS